VGVIGIVNDPTDAFSSEIEGFFDNGKRDRKLQTNKKYNNTNKKQPRSFSFVRS
jgi:hypothetical protein